MIHVKDSNLWSESAYLFLSHPNGYKGRSQIHLDE